MVNQLFIDNELCPASSGRTEKLVNPATEKVITEVSAAGESEVEKAVKGSDRAFDEIWRDMAPGKRSSILFSLSHKIKGALEELAQLETAQVGKPINDSRDEVAAGARVFEYYAGAISQIFGQTIPVGRGGFDFTLKQPMGVVAGIVPWNFPFLIACWKIAPAMAAGNCMILKPATASPLTALRLGQLAAEAGLPPGVLQILTGSG